MTWIIERTLEFEATIERVWRAISDPAELSRWFPDRAELELKTGATGSLVWDDHGSFDIEVLEVEPPHRLVWCWAGGEDRPLQEYSTRVEWTLSEDAQGKTTLHLRETGFDSEQNYNDNSDGWTEELGELVAYLAAATDGASATA